MTDSHSYFSAIISLYCNNFKHSFDIDNSTLKVANVTTSPSYRYAIKYNLSYCYSISNFSLLQLPCLWIPNSRCQKCDYYCKITFRNTFDIFQIFTRKYVALSKNSACFAHSHADARCIVPTLAKKIVATLAFPFWSEQLSKMVIINK